MIITGLPRAGSSLLLLLCQSVTNKRVVLDKEHHWSNPHMIAKCPFALIRNKAAEDVVLTLRDPRDVVTSKSHPRWPNTYVFGWEKAEGKGPYGLKQIWAALEPHLATAHIVSYYELVQSPDSIQRDLGERFGLEYDRPFSQWPTGFKVKAYWEMNGLGDQRPIHQSRSWRDDPQDRQRIEELSQYPEFNRCVEEINAVLQQVRTDEGAEEVPQRAL